MQKQSSKQSSKPATQAVLAPAPIVVPPQAPLPVVAPVAPVQAPVPAAHVGVPSPVLVFGAKAPKPQTTGAGNQKSDTQGAWSTVAGAVGTGVTLAALNALFAGTAGAKKGYPVYFVRRGWLVPAALVQAPVAAPVAPTATLVVVPVAA